MMRGAKNFEDNHAGLSAEDAAHILDRFDARWQLMHNVLHSAGFVLGPANRSMVTWNGLTFK